jgi:hypothetical protein
MSKFDARVPFPLGVSQSINVVTASARTSAGVGAFTRVVLIYSSTDAYYNFGDSTVTATTSDTFIPAGSEHLVQIRGGQYVAAIRNSADGVMKISEMAY